MIHGDKVYGKPLVMYPETKANIEAMAGLAEGSTAYATDTNQFGSYNGSTWTWGQGFTTNKYRQWLYTASGGNLTILTDATGNPLTALCDLE